MTINELSATIKAKAEIYMAEGSEGSTMPSSIVDFVLDYAINESHFPDYFTEDRIATRLSKCASTLAMACIEVYSRVGAEGEKAHSENAIARTYDGAWISTRLHDVLPNYVGVV